MEEDTILRLDYVDSYTNIPCTAQKIIFSRYKDEYYSKLKIPFGCKLYEGNKEITLLRACKKGFRETAMGIILNNEVDDAGEIDEHGFTALIEACANSMPDVASLLIKTFGDKCNPQHVNRFGATALMWACARCMSDVATLLITTFGEKCNPQQVSHHSTTALIITCINSMSDVATLLITTFGDKCNPRHINKSGLVSLLVSVSQSMSVVAVHLISTFREPKRIDNIGCTALSWAVKNNMNDFVVLIKHYV
jgi:ankyrin repeat protein